MQWRVLLVSTACAMAVGSCQSQALVRDSATADVDEDTPPQLIGHRSLYVGGEYMAFHLTWRGIKGGVTQLVAGEPGEVSGRRTLLVTSESRGAGIVAVFRELRDALTSTIDLDHGAPTRAESVFETGRLVERVTVDVDGVVCRGTYEPADGAARSWDQHVVGTTRVHNLHSSLAVLRAWNPPLGARGYWFAQTGRSFYRIDVTAAGTDVLNLADLGRVSVRRVEGTVFRLTQDGRDNPSRTSRRFTVWFSADERALPVRWEAQTSRGAVAATLFEYRQNPAARFVLDHGPTPSTYSPSAP